MSVRAPVPCEGGNTPAALTALYSALQGGLGGAGTGPLVMTALGSSPSAILERVTQPWDGVDVVIATSGSTSGAGNLVGLSYAALAASARATFETLRGPGQWLTSLPAHHIAGFQVVLRSALAGIPPVVHSGDPRRLAEEISSMRADVPRYLSLVPTQVLRILEADPTPLTHLDAILVGGAALPAPLAERARAAGVPIVTTYGMTETSGGCVYDGVPLPGVSVTLEDSRVLIAGPTLATRYLHTSAQPFRTVGGVRHLVTSDLGEWQGDRLAILGRSDDVIISGGVNVPPAVVEEAITAALGSLWSVVGVPDERWGALVVAVTEGDAPLERVREATAHLAPAFRPRAVVSAQLPHLPSGKVDRRAVAELAAAALREGRAELHG
ncbi:MAG: AMP-binding protein [bacterium]|nr:AMP-binding protein [bacterium]